MGHKRFTSLIFTVNYHIYRFIIYGKNPFTYDYKKDINIGLLTRMVNKEQVVKYVSKADLVNIVVTGL
jgi:hypothetical protein